MSTPASPRFLTLVDVTETLNISMSQALALVRSGELRGIKIGGRGQWRVENVELESYIARMYDETARALGAEHPDPAAARPGQPRPAATRSDDA